MAKWSFSVHGVTRIITSNIYTRLAACNCISITFWSGDLPSPLMAIFYTNLTSQNIRVITKMGLHYFCAK